MSVYVYKITRNDDLEYIGITIELDKRIKEHTKSSRFSIGIKNVTVLEETEDYNIAERLEEHYIEIYDTYNNGLNITKNGKGLNENCKFNTLGHKYSDKSKKKMSQKAKDRYKNDNNHPWKQAITEKEKQHFSKIRKGYSWGNKKISDQDAKLIFNSYIADDIKFDNSEIIKYIKKSQRSIIKDLKFDELITPGGQKLSKLKLYCVYYAEKYGITPNGIRRIIKHNGEHCKSYKERQV